MDLDTLLGLFEETGDDEFDTLWNLYFIPDNP